MPASRLVLFISLLLAGFPVFSQQYNFRNYSVGEGLAQSQVYAMIEDRRGYLWLGTRGGGLSVFDGLEFRSYTETDGLVNNFIRCMLEDREGRIWIGTDEGLCYYDGKKFTALQVPENKAALMNALCEDKQGRLWVGTDEAGVYVYENGKFTRHFWKENGLPDNTVNCITQDDKGRMWIGTENGTVRLSGDPAKPALKVFTRKEGLPANNIRDIRQDKNGALWFASYGNGLAVLRGEKFTRYSVSEGLTTNTLHALLPDSKKRLWVATPIGVCRFDGEDFTVFSEGNGLASNVVMCMLEDSWGNIWFGTSGGGLSRLDGERFLHFNEKSGEMGAWVYSLLEDDQGNMWFATSNGGVTKYDGKYYTNYRETQGFTAAKVRTMHIDANGTLWFGTVSDGAWSYDGEVFRQFLRRDGLSSNFVNCIASDPQGRVWMGTAGGGISIYDPATKKFQHIGKKEKLQAERILSLLIDRNGEAWAGTVGYGAYRLSCDTAGKVKITNHYSPGNGLPSSTVRSITSDPAGNIYFGMAGGGVVRCDPRKKGNAAFTNWSTAEGLASGNIYSLVVDNQGYLWVGTEKGVDRLDKRRKNSVRHYGKAEGFTGIEVSQNAVCVDKLGHVWFGTIHGATRYDPKADVSDAVAPRLQFTGLRLFFDPISATPYGQGTSSWKPLPSSLILPHETNHLRFEFAGIHLRNPQGVRYRWLLEGFDPGWSPESDEQQAVYSNIPPGSYTFNVKARNADGVWSKQESFSFSITPPFYATWPFRVAAVLAAALLVWLLLRLRIRTLKRRSQAQLEKLELEKSKVELERNLLDLEQKALRLQMNPHFIFNALNSIQGFVTRNDVGEAKRYLAKFAKLMRMILENSRQSHTSITQEAELLHNYLGLEKICHGNRFDFRVDFSDELDPELTLIPVMLIQPFVENAVLHGVRHRGEGGFIEVLFRQEGDHVTCTVSDNGVGRKRAAELESSQPKEHESAALKITEERLEHLNSEGENGNSITIDDLFHEDGSPAGTRVTIRMRAMTDE